MSSGVFGKCPEHPRTEIASRIDRRKDLHHYDCFLHNIADSSRDKVQQYIDTPLCASLDLDCCLTYSLYTTSHEIDINFRGISIMNPSAEYTPKEGTNVLLQLAQQRVYIVLVGQANHDIQLFHFDVQRVVILAEKYTHLVGQDIAALL